MKKCLFLSLVLFFLLTPIAHAEALFVVKENGDVQKSVLGDSTDIQQKVGDISRQIASDALNGVKEIAISEFENKTHIKLEIPPKSEDESLSPELTQLVNLEGEAPSDKISVTKEDGGFGINDHGVTAVTNLPVTITPKDHKVSIETSSGQVVLTTMPSDAVKIVVTKNFINTLTSDPINIAEVDGQLEYLIDGEKTITIPNVTRVTAPVSLSVSVTTGEVHVVSEPKWLPILGLLFN